jgi:hypothetical protein
MTQGGTNKAEKKAGTEQTAEKSLFFFAQNLSTMFSAKTAASSTLKILLRLEKRKLSI